MAQPPAISAAPPPRRAQDFAILREVAMDEVRARAGLTWTDHNAHDAGISILEAVCYAITELGLKLDQDLPDLITTTAQLTLLKAANPRQEALALALILLRAISRNQRAALITPDRSLARRVEAQLDRWGILPDDSAGSPLALSAPGRLLRHIARAFGGLVAMNHAVGKPTRKAKTVVSSDSFTERQKILRLASAQASEPSKMSLVNKMPCQASSEKPQVTLPYSPGGMKE
jgi:hypothetical protein